jgi:uncharacterized protein (TIGR03067 family)
MTSGKADGQAMPDNMRTASKRVCRGDETTVTVGGQLLMKARFTLDPTRKPKTIDYEMIDGWTKGKKQLGIYELEWREFLQALRRAPAAGLAIPAVPVTP